MIRMNNFTKVNILILILLVPVLILYIYSNQKNIGVMEQHIRDSQINRLSSLHKQLDDNVKQISMMAYVLLRDPNVKEFRDLDLYAKDANYTAFKTEQIISQKLNLQSVANAFTNSITIYAPRIQKAIGQHSLVHYNQNEIDRYAMPDWQYSQTDKQFTLYAFDPIHEHNLVANASLIAKVGFSVDNIVKLLDNFHGEGNGGTFLYNPADRTVIPSGSTAKLADGIANEISSWDLGNQGYETVDIDQSNYFINYVKSDGLAWYLVDYVPMQEIITPITSSNRYFFLFLGILMCVNLLILYILHSNIRRPIKELIRGVQQMKKGNYAARIQIESENEFKFLFQRFNEMAGEIENLIGKVYAEQIYSREATLKQLQSQINPHFLYNCLAFIKSMAVLEEKESIIAMSVSLSKYYRYNTRNEKQLVTIREEMELVNSYLKIQGLQMKRLQVIVDIPDDMLDLAIPRLLIQPIIENAIIHGIEPHPDGGQLTIRGERREGENRIIVEDDGPGLDEQGRLMLSKKINMPLSDEIGCGLWNVHQRLRLQFSPESGLQFESNSSGGLRVILYWT
ncbi:hypothetical protein B1748_12125 [Paenibacillus sp. MY03]|uniref:sensor histidine kinase n=1 Tax=Paenibacillus sp. MY03 TaxID=302980 RepID=UPI000B3C76FC|nr:histidine kinase [Paenibacillus sp. MY03]OUS76424.1 hypothetical protein B1748_12125 [Paenibacillus sp. MY03]